MDVKESKYGERCQFKESDVFTPGDSLTILDVDGFKIGICICFDIRFEELGRIYRSEGSIRQNQISKNPIKFTRYFPL